ncbi:MAG: tryptophan--tRNA ligase [Deltaproteobacteria bacterium]|nr:MAG: tryptophan--tRNA ligase [Deltaproteobacteria bacterium]
MTKKKRLLSGMQPSGALHLGNYLGALKQWVERMDIYDCYYCVVDYHAITIPYDTEQMKTRIFDATVDYLAGGLDPEKCVIFVQSDVPEHMELAWIFNAVTPLGQLMRMTQFKQKAQHAAAKVLGDSNASGNEDDDVQSDLSDAFDTDTTGDDGLKVPLSGIGKINSGLLNYPVLQAADILIYKAEVVPVGEDQVQHIELTRDIARRFNNRFNDVFPLCEAMLSEAPRVMGLDGVNKMSKSLGNHIPLNLGRKQLTKLVTKQAVSDSRRVTLEDPGVPEECNVYAYHKLFSTEEEQQWAHDGCTQASIGCFHCKKAVAKNINDLLDPIRERREEILKSPDTVNDILAEGAKKARAVAQETLEQTREALGFLGKPR